MVINYFQKMYERSEAYVVNENIEETRQMEEKLRDQIFGLAGE